MLSGSGNDRNVSHLTTQMQSSETRASSLRAVPKLLAPQSHWQKSPHAEGHPHPKLPQAVFEEESICVLAKGKYDTVQR